MDFADARGESFEAGLDFGDHAGVNGPVADERLGVACGEGVNQRVGIILVAADAIDIAQKDQLLGPQRLSDGGGRRIGIDVEFSSVLSQAHRRDHRDNPLTTQLFDRFAFHAGDGPHVAQVDWFRILPVKADAVPEQQVPSPEIQGLRLTAELLDRSLPGSH